jgi:hypothetical protein
VRLALLAIAACLGLSGCATIKSWFAPSAPPARAEQPDESLRRAAHPEAPAAPRAAPPVPAAPQPAPPAPPTPRAAPPVPATPRAAPSAPAPPRPSEPGPAAPAPPSDVSPPVLSPVLSPVDEQKLRAEAQRRIDGAERRLRQVDAAKLASSEQDSLQTVQSFLDKARAALQTQDVQRAFTLADKAYLLADELAGRPR